MATRALPDLVARARMDRSDYKAGVGEIKEGNAQLQASILKLRQETIALASSFKGAAQAYQGTAFRDAAIAMEADLAALERGLGSGGSAHAKHAMAVEQDALALGKLGERGLEAIGVLERVASVAGSSSGAFGRASTSLSFIGLPGLGAAAGALGIVAFLDEMSKKAADYGKAVLEDARALGLTNEQYQIWQQNAARGGIDQDKFNTTIQHFNDVLGTGAKALQAEGTSLDAIGITSRNTNEALRQAADFLSKDTDATQSAVIAQALFGKGAVQLLPVLQKGNDVLDQQAQEMRDYGLILSDNRIQLDAVAAASREQFGEVAKSIELNFGSELQQGFIELFTVLTAGAGGVEKAFDSIGAAIGRDIGWVASFLSGLLDLGVTQTTMDDQQKKLMERIDAQVAKDNGFRQIQSDANKASAEIKDLTEAEKEHGRVLDQETKATEDSQKAYDASADARLRALQADMKALDLKRQLIQAARTAADDQRKVDRDQADLTAATFEGNYNKVKTLGDQLSADKEKQADDQATATIDADKRALQTKIDSITEEKRAQDALFQAHIDEIADTREKERTATEARIAELQKIVDRAHIDDNSILSSGNAAAAGTVQGWKEGAAAISQTFDTAAESIGATFHRLLTGQKLTPEDKARLDEFGHAIGSAIVGGVWSVVDAFFVDLGGAIAGSLTGKDYDAWKSLGAGADKVRNFNQWLPFISHASGGDVLPRTPYLVGEQGPELRMFDDPGQIISNDRIRAALGGSGPSQQAPTVVNNITLNFPHLRSDDQLIRDIEAAVGSMLNRQ